MKRIIISFVLLSFFLINAYSKEDKFITIVSGAEKINEIKKDKKAKISVGVTFNDLIFWKKPIDTYIEDVEKEEGKKVDKDKMIKNFKSKVADGCKKRGAKWKMKFVEEPASVTDGYILMINYDECFPIPGVSGTGSGTLKLYQAGDMETVLAEIKMNTFFLATSFSDFSPYVQFEKLGFEFIRDFVNDVLKKK